MGHAVVHINPSGQLGQSVLIPPPPISCLWGDAYLDAKGNWQCPPYPTRTGKDIKPPIDCFWGTPYQDKNGEWRCSDNSQSSVPVITATPPLNPGMYLPAPFVKQRRYLGPPYPDRTIQKMPAVNSEPVPLVKKPGEPATPAADNLIFGFAPTTLLIIAAVGAGLYFMSQVGEVKK